MLKKLLVLSLMLLLTTSGFARAGSSYKSVGYSRSSSSYSNSKSYSGGTSSSYSYGGGTQYKPSPSYSYASTAPKNVTINKTYTVNHTTPSYSGNSGGTGIMGTMVGVAGGVVAGNLITDALTKDHRNDGYAPQGGYVNNPNGNGYPAPNQPVSPQVVGDNSGSTQYVTDGNGGFKPVIQQEKPFDWVLFFVIILGMLIGAVIMFWLVPALWRKYKEMKEQKEFNNRENNLENLGEIFIRVQEAYSRGQAGKAEMRNLCTEDQYNRFYNISSTNEEDGFTNYVKDVKILNLTTVSYNEYSGVKHHSVKIRFSMIDYTVNEKGEVTHGSETQPQTDVEIWEFVSSNDKTWKLNSIR